MKYNKTIILSLFVVGTFLVSILGNAPVASGEEFIETNFDIWFYTQVGSTTREGMGLYLKQAVAPLGINVKVVAKPWGQFVGDLLHRSSGQPFDIALVGFIGFTETVDFCWTYCSDPTLTSYGDLMYQLEDPEWQKWQVSDTGVNNTDVDNLLLDLDFEINVTRRQELADEFAELFMTKLLYDIPSISTESRVSIWKGYGGAENELYDANEGVVTSRKFGAKWDPNPSAREGAADELRFYNSPPETYTFDPMEVRDTATGILSDYSYDTLTTRDKNFVRHPSLAYNWFAQDWDVYGNGSSISQLGNHTFWINSGINWDAPLDGSYVATELTAKDFIFGLQLYQMDNIIANGKPNYAHVVDYKIYDDYSFSLFVEKGWTTPDDGAVYGGLYPYPTHILNKTLTASDGTEGTPIALDKLGYNPQTTDEWKKWKSFQGHTSIGPYRPIQLTEGETFSIEARADYWYPNEWDAAAHPNVKGGVFGAHLRSTNPDAYYWGFAGTETTKTKPTSQGINKVTWVELIDPNARMIKFESGGFDTFSPLAFGAQKVEDHDLDPRFSVKALVRNTGPQLYIFNLKNPHLRKYNVRKAIHHAMDKQQMLKIVDGFAVPNDSPVPTFIKKYYKPFTIPYDYAKARDLMRDEGYSAADSNAPDDQAAAIPVNVVTEQVGEEAQVVVSEITESLGSNLLIGLSGMAMISVIVLRKRKK